MKDTLKTLTLLEEHLSRLAEQGIYEIERDLILERLRQLYSIVATSELLPDSLIDEPEMYGCPPVEYEPIVEDEPEVEEEIAEEPVEQEEEEEEKTLIEEVADKWLSNILQIDKQESEEPEIEEVKEEEGEQATAKAQDEELDHEVVMSLYDDDEDDEIAVAPAPETPETPEEEPIEEVVAEPKEPEFEQEQPIIIDEEPEEPEFEEVAEADEELNEPTEAEADEELNEPTEADAPQSVVLGDILGTEQITIADNLAEQVLDVATATTANLSLRQTIAINDKFILMRDLFAGNNAYYEMAIDRLDSFDNLDDAMLYIYDNFHWNPNCEGARLLMELLARKLI